MVTHSRSVLLAGIHQKQAELAKMATLVESLDNEEIELLLSLLSESQQSRDSITTTVVPEPVSHRAERLNYDAGTGKVESAVRNAIRDMEHFSVPEVVRLLENSGFLFTAKSPLSAVNQVIRKLKDRGQVEEIEAGSGRKPSKYKNLSVEGSEQLSMAS